MPLRKMMTRSGRLVNPLDINPADVVVEDIAFHLSNKSRFSGATDFYSVAEHSVLVSLVVPPRYALAALLHDAVEAYTGDVNAMIKPLMYVRDPCGGFTSFREVEREQLRRVFDGLVIPQPSDVCQQHIHLADLAVGAKEVRSLFPEHLGDQFTYYADVEPAPVAISGYSPCYAAYLFTERYHALRKA